VDGLPIPQVVDLKEVGHDVVKEKPQKGDHFCVRFYPKGDLSVSPRSGSASQTHRRDH
jgi:hypothetical protein